MRAPQACTTCKIGRLGDTQCGVAVFNKRCQPAKNGEVTLQKLQERAAEEMIEVSDFIAKHTCGFGTVLDSVEVLVVAGLRRIYEPKQKRPARERSVKTRKGE